MKIILPPLTLFFVGLLLSACVGARMEGEVLPPSPSPTVTPTRRARPTATPSALASPVTSALPPSLLLPVVGVRREQLHDTFNEARSEGRVHEAIDILAPQGTNVVAAADGTIVKLFTSDKGGITIYQLSRDQQLVFYYAHLERYADGLTETQAVRQGDLLGYVGDTGNAQPGNYHLHFAIWQITDPKSFWTGTNLNPYDLFTRR